MSMDYGLRTFLQYFYGASKCFVLTFVPKRAFSYPKCLFSITVWTRVTHFSLFAATPGNASDSPEFTYTWSPCGVKTETVTHLVLACEGLNPHLWLSPTSPRQWFFGEDVEVV